MGTTRNFIIQYLSRHHVTREKVSDGTDLLRDVKLSHYQFARLVKELETNFKVDAPTRYWREFTKVGDLKNHFSTLPKA